MVTVQLKQIDIFPGQKLLLRDISWELFEEILQELGEERTLRVAYSRGNLEIMTPSPEHEVLKGILGDLVKILLEELNIDCESFGSSTFKRQDMQGGIEPDESFYIKNYRQMIGKSRLDLSIDPPPDLVIEIDVTSKTQLDAYKALGVLEVWCFENSTLQIDILLDGQYIQSNTSPTFPNLPIIKIIPQYIAQARSSGRSAALRAFRQWVRNQSKTQ